MEAEAKLLTDAETWQQIGSLRKDVRRDRDRHNASSLGLMFLDQPASHPYRIQPLIWTEPSYFGEAKWLPPVGEWLCAIGAPTQDGTDHVCYHVFFDGVNEAACRKFREHACEIAALSERLGYSTDVLLSPEEVLVRTLFSLDQTELLWEKNEQPGHPETKSRIARLKDVYGLTEMFLAVLLELYVPDSPNSEATDGRDKAGSRVNVPNDLEKRVASLESQTKKPPTKTKVIRNQRIKFCCPKRRKKSPDTWNEIYDAYHKNFPNDKKASPDTLLHSHDRNCLKCREQKS